MTDKDSSPLGPVDVEITSKEEAVALVRENALQKEAGQTEQGCCKGEDATEGGCCKDQPETTQKQANQMENKTDGCCKDQPAAEKTDDCCKNKATTDTARANEESCCKDKAGTQNPAPTGNPTDGSAAASSTVNNSAAAATAATAAATTLQNSARTSAKEKTRIVASPRTIILSALTDLVLVAIFAFIGRRSHGLELNALAILQTAWPFIAGLALSWILARIYAEPISPIRAGIALWLGTALIGLGLRGLTGGGLALAFVIVALTVLGAFLLGWRLIAALTLKLQKHAKK